MTVAVLEIEEHARVGPCCCRGALPHQCVANRARSTGNADWPLSMGQTSVWISWRVKLSGGGVRGTPRGDGCGPRDSLPKFRLGCGARSLTAAGIRAHCERSGWCAEGCEEWRGTATSRYAAGNCLYNVRHAGIPCRLMGVRCVFRTNCI